MLIGKIIIYVALAVMPPPLTFGLPSCRDSTVGLTERYNQAYEILYIDECRNGIITAANLPIIDMTTSVVIIMTSDGEVTIQLPQLDRSPFPTSPTFIQSSNIEDNQSQNEPVPADSDQEMDCDKVKLSLDDCLMGPK